MTTTQRVLATLSFVIILGGAACDGTDIGSRGPEPVFEPAAHEESAPLAQADDGRGCGCGHFLDGDGDGLCDQGASGECRKARDGRCPCGGDCTGCL